MYTDHLRNLSWSGIPSSVRATTWQLLCVSYLLLMCKYPPDSIII